MSLIQVMAASDPTCTPTLVAPSSVANEPIRLFCGTASATPER